MCCIAFPYISLDIEEPITTYFIACTTSRFFYFDSSLSYATSLRNDIKKRSDSNLPREPQIQSASAIYVDCEPPIQNEIGLVLIKEFSKKSPISWLPLNRAFILLLLGTRSIDRERRAASLAKAGDG